MDYWNVKPVGQPYWRLYWNRTAGARMTHEGQTVDLGPALVALVAPHTPFAAHFIHPFEHYFVHFQLGYPYDWLSNRIFVSPVPHMLAIRLNALADQLRQRCPAGHRYQWRLQSVLSWVMAEVPASAWPRLPGDPRILATLEYIDRNTTLVSNADLARRVHMSCNGFVRLFRNEMGVSPQRYLLRQRLTKACRLLTCSDETVEHIADECGFCDRNYFSAVFKRYYRMGPAHYRNSVKAELASGEAIT